MTVLLDLFIFIFGTIFGSFLNCVIYRLAVPEKRISPNGAGRETGNSFLKGRSFCPHCKHILSWQDLIPIFSFLFLKGKCRYCKKLVSLQYPLVEIFTGFLFLLIFQYTKYQIPYTIYELIIACFLIIIFVYDLKHYIIPDRVIYPAIAISGIWCLFFNPALITLYSAFGAAAFFLAIVLITRGKGMGVGDIKLAFLMGLFLGWPNILIALFLAFFIGAAIGIILIISNRKTMKSEIPFGPFLVLGTFLALFFGENLIDWYFSLFLLK